jgi:hypothetical protein
MILLLVTFSPPLLHAQSKKGLQVEMIDDALALGIKHAALNLNLSQLIVPTPKPGQQTATWTRGEDTFHFSQNYLRSLDQKIRPLSKNGVEIKLIILAYRSHDPAINRILLHPKYHPDAPNNLGAFNTVTPEGKRWLHASLEFLARRYSTPEQTFGHVTGYIIGNEVNSHWWWANRGEVTMEEFAADYHEAVRLMHHAIRRQSPGPKVYISLEHHWNMRYPPANELKAFPAKAFIDHFAKIVKERGDFDWHLAFHPYPESLRDPEFWKDTTATNSPDTRRITFKNLPVLTEYLKKPELLYQGKPRRITLSEQGFDTPKGPGGQKIQAAAYAYAYRLVDQLDGIDSFILHRHVDHPKEGGLRLGLRTFAPARDKKFIYNVFLHADTPDWEKHFAFALPIIGLTEWPKEPSPVPTK